MTAELTSARAAIPELLTSTALLYACLGAFIAIKVPAGTFLGQPFSWNLVLTVLLATAFLLVALQRRPWRQFSVETFAVLWLAWVTFSTLLGSLHSGSLQFLSAHILLVGSVIAFRSGLRLDRDLLRHSDISFLSSSAAALWLFLGIPAGGPGSRGLAPVLGLMAVYCTGELLFPSKGLRPRLYWWFIPPLLMHASAFGGRRGPTVFALVAIALVFLVHAAFSIRNRPASRRQNVSAIMLVIAVATAVLQPNFVERWAWSASPPEVAANNPSPSSPALFAEGDVALPFGMRVISMGRIRFTAAIFDQLELRGLRDLTLGVAGSSYELMNEAFPGLEHPHNDYLKVLMDFGLLGLAVLGGSLGFLMLSLGNRLRSALLRRSAPVGLGPLAGLVYASLLFATDNTLTYSFYVIVLAFVVSRGLHALSTPHASLLDAGQE